MNKIDEILQKIEKITENKKNKKVKTKILLKNIKNHRKLLEKSRKMLNILLLLLIGLLCIIYIELQKWRIQRRMTGFTKPKQLPILGVAGRFINKTNDQMMDLLHDLMVEVQYKTPVQTWFGPFLAVVIADAADMQVIFNHVDCLNHPYFYNNFGIGTALGVAKRELWKPQRRTFEPVFNFKMLPNYIPHLNIKSKELVQEFSKHIAQPGDLARVIFIGHIDMIIQTTTGIDRHIQTTELGAMLHKTIKQLMANMMYRTTRIWLKWDFTYSLTRVYRSDRPLWQGAERFLNDIIDEKSAKFEEFQRKGVDYLADVHKNGSINLLEKCLLLERENGASRTKTIDQMNGVLIGGIVSSSTTIHTTLLMLAMYPQYQDAVVAELKSIFESPDCDVTNEHLPNLLYLERCIRESMRLFAPTPLAARQTTADIQLAGGIIPKDTTIILDIFHLHRNPEIWGDNVMEYDPDRFLPENTAKRPPYSFIPFVAGPRKCIGMKYAMVSMKITLAHLLRRYKFTTTLQMHEIRFKLSLAMDIVNECPIGVERRVF